MNNFFFSARQKKLQPTFQSATSVHRIMSSCVLSFLLFVCGFAMPAAAQEPADKSAPSAAIVRPCSAASANSKAARKDKKGKGAADASKPQPDCLEARETALNLQEFLQSFVREQKWKIGEEKTAEDGWTFTRYLDKDELVRFSKEEPFAGRVNWSEGKAFLQVKTAELEKGFTRVQISARIQGYGQNDDRFAPPQDSWDLRSNGTLENNLISALEAHFQSMK
jgi:hypothetical protein